MFTAVLVWSPPLAFMLSWIGAIGTGLTSYGLGRFIVRDWVQQKLPSRLKRYDERLEKHSFRIVLLLRLLFFTTPSVQLMLGVSRVRFIPFLLATALGYVPIPLIFTLFGASGIAWIEAHPGKTLAIVAVGIATLLLAGAIYWSLRRVKNREKL